MVEEFWNDIVTQKSFEKLIEISKKYKFVVIGGWAVYLLTNMHKSKDIDIIIDYNVLLELKSEYTLEKNDRLKKYEIKTGDFDIDIYLPSFSKLMLPISRIISSTQSAKGFEIPKSEVLVVLKQGAEIDRRSSIKGRKDLIDILTLLIFSGFDAKYYLKLIEEENMFFLKKELIDEVKRFDLKDLKYLNMNTKNFADWKKNFLKSLV